MKSTSDGGLLKGRLQVLHVHVLFVAPLSTSHTAHRKLQKQRATVRADRTASTAQKKVIQRRYATAKRQQAAMAANQAKSVAKKTVEGVKKAALWVYGNRKTCLISWAWPLWWASC